MTQPPFPVVFDPLQRRRVRTRAYRHFSDDARFLQDWADKQMKDRLDDIKRTFTAPLFLNPDVLLNDSMMQEILDVPPVSHDLIVSNLWLHTINDLPGMLIQIKRALKPDGLFIGAMFGGESLRELRETLHITEMEIAGGVSPRVAPFADKLQMAGLMQRAGYALPVVDSEIVTVTYPHLKKLMHDLRGMGETNILAQRNKQFLRAGFIERADLVYADKFAEADGLPASFEIIFLLGWAPHASQQQPLKPGSAQVRLADILSTDEDTPT